MPPIVNIPLFAFGAAYIGDYGSSSTMTAITDLRTNGANLDEQFPTQYEVLLGKDIQTGNHLFTIDLDFYSDGLLTGVISRGNPITTAAINSAPGTSLYTLLLVAPYANYQDSYFFPNVRTARTRKVKYSKTDPTVLRITFIAENRNPNVDLFYQDTIPNLIADTPLGPISPF